MIPCGIGGFVKYDCRMEGQEERNCTLKRSDLVLNAGGSGVEFAC